MISLAAKYDTELKYPLASVHVTLSGQSKRLLSFWKIESCIGNMLWLTGERGIQFRHFQRKDNNCQRSLEHV